MIQFLSPFLLLFVIHFSNANSVPPAVDKYPQVISHRGASGYVPEHSLEAYQLGMDLLTDYIEPDLCLSKDGIFMALHDMLLDDTTNVADFPQYSERKTTKVVDGQNKTGYFISDFTYSELKGLRLNQRLEQRTHLYDGLLTMPSLEEILDLVQQYYQATNRTVGVYIELKSPSFFNSLGFDMENMLLKQLSVYGYRVYKNENVPNDFRKVLPVVYQCFDSESLKKMRSLSDLPLIYLYAKPGLNKWKSKTFLEEVKTFADGIGPDKATFGDPPFHVSSPVVANIHASGLYFHPYTFRVDQDILKKFHDDFELEQTYFYCCLGTDALFTEFPDRSRQVLSQLALKKKETTCPIDCDQF